MGRWSGQPLGDLSGEPKIGELVSGARRQQLSKLPELSMAAGLLLPWAPSDSLYLFTLLQPSCRAASGQEAWHLCSFLTCPVLS